MKHYPEADWHFDATEVNNNLRYVQLTRKFKYSPVLLRHLRHYQRTARAMVKPETCMWDMCVMDEDKTFTHIITVTFNAVIDQGEINEFKALVGSFASKFKELK